MNSAHINETAVFGGGCFWCTEAVFRSLKGVVSVVSGYSGGTIKNPTYEEVCNGKTGYAEVVEITFDPLILSFEDLLSVFFNAHNPTTMNRQGNDIGSQYRSVIFYTNDQQKLVAEQLVRELNEMKAYDAPIITEVTPFTLFYEAEKYHQGYYERNKEQGYCELIIAPKLEKLQKRFERLLKDSQENK